MLPSFSQILTPDRHLSALIETNGSGSLSRGGSIELDIIRELCLLSRKIAGAATLGSLNLDTKNLSRELEDLVLYLAVLFADS